VPRPGTPPPSQETQSGSAAPIEPDAITQVRKTDAVPCRRPSATPPPPIEPDVKTQVRSSCGVSDADNGLGHELGARKGPGPGGHRAFGTKRAPPTMFRVWPEHSWRWRESNPRPSVHQQGFSERSLLCFSQPRHSHRQDADRLSHCSMSRAGPVTGPDGDPSS
jgi:hypothetical protein